MSPLQSEPFTPPLSLKNDGDLEVAFLGTGTAFSIEEGHTNLFVIKGDHHILIDFGTTGPTQLQKIARLSPLDVRTFLPTHAHADHVGGLEALAIYNRYMGVLPGRLPKLKVIIHPEFRKNLWDMTLRGGLGFNEPGMHGQDELFAEYFDVIIPEKISGPGEREVWEVDAAGFSIRLIRTDHTQGEEAPDGSEFYTHAVLIDKTVFFSGDTSFDPVLLREHASEASLIIHDAGVVDTPLHPTIAQLRTLPAEMRAKMLLAHYPEEARDTDLTGFLGLAETGLRYRLRSRPAS